MDLVFSCTRRIPKKSWGQECSLCSSTHGVPIECSARDCKTAYHTTCAIRAKLKMQAIFGKNFKGGIKLRSYCKYHSPEVTADEGSTQADKIDASGVKEIDMTNLADDRLQTANEELDYFWKYVDINEVHKTISEAHARSTRLRIVSQSDTTDGEHESTPKKSTKKAKLEPNCSSPSKKISNTTPKKNKLKNEPAKLAIQTSSSPSNCKTQDVDPLMIDLIYRYWILLRTANNGQSLIKFSPSALKERENEQRKSILKLRIELERVRNLSYMIGKREKLKASWLRTHQNIIKRTFNIISDLNPPIDTHIALGPTNDDATVGNSSNQVTSYNQPHSTATSNGKKSLHATPHLLPTNGIFDESEQLINDLITCDTIYELPNYSTNNNHGILSHQDKSTLERRRTLSLVRRINRQLKSVCMEPSLNPYARSYLAPKRSDSPVAVQHNQTVKMLKFSR